MTALPGITTVVLPCRIGDQAGRCRVHLGRPARGFSRVHFQLAWLRETRGGEVSAEVLAALAPADQEAG